MKPTNPNFGSNFSNDNMAQSVKLADYTGSDHEANVRKQFVKYATGGKDQYDVSEQKQKSEVKFDMAGIKPIKTEQSQISGIDTGFRKLKANQGDILKHLREQFEQIKNIPTNEHQAPQKMSNSSEQSHQSVPRADSSSPSIQSSKINKKINANNQREERLWEVERKQYQFMLNNCQLKIEELLHNEMQYKKMIHELRSSNFLIKAPVVENKFQTQYKQLQKQLKQEKEKNYKLSSQLQKLKLASKQQLEKLSKLESQSSFRSKDESKLNEEKKRLEENIRLQKDRFLNCQIEKRKYQMQNQLLLKEKQQDMLRFQRQIEHQNVVNQLNLKSLMKKFEDEIEIKDKRYMLLVSQYEKLKKQYTITKEQAQKPPPVNNNNNNQFFEIFKTLIQEKRNNNPNEELTRTVKHLLEKLQEKPQEPPKRYEPEYVIPRREYQFNQDNDHHKDHDHDDDDDNDHDHEAENQYAQKLLSEIRILKAEIEAFKNSGEGIDLEPMKRMYEAEIAALKDTIAILQRKLKNISPQVIKQETPIAFKKEREIAELQRRIRQLEESAKISKPDNSFSFEQQEQFITSQKQKLEQVEAELRTERRKKSEAQFELTKLSKEMQFRISILKNQNLSQLQIKQGQIDQANKNIQYWRKQFENMRNFYEQKLSQKNRLLEQYLNTTSLDQIKKKSQESLNQVKLDYEKQIKAITERLSNYKTQSLQYDALLKKYTALESNYLELRKSLFRSKQINDGIDHLWQIKETQYGNVNEILNQVSHNRRATQYLLPNNGGLSSISQPSRQLNEASVVRPSSISGQEQNIYTGYSNQINQSQVRLQPLPQPQPLTQTGMSRSGSLNFSGPSNPVNLNGSTNQAFSSQGAFMNSMPTRTSYEVNNAFVDPNARTSFYNNEAGLLRNSSGAVGLNANRTSLAYSGGEPVTYTSNYRTSSSGNYQQSQSFVNTYPNPVYG